MSLKMTLGHLNCLTAMGPRGADRFLPQAGPSYLHMLTSGIGPETSALPMRCATYCATSAKPRRFYHSDYIKVKYSNLIFSLYFSFP